MAGIVGIFCADGRPADVSALRRMTDSVPFRGPDGVAYWNSGPVALAHMQFFTTPESLEERQPLLSASGDVCLVWNGRVDNRDELIADLAAAGVRPVDETDPGLVLAAYLAWGTKCVQRIVGDFALALWDAQRQRMWCVCDYIGVRPFYYYWDGKTFVFGPDVRAMLAHPDVSLKINEGMAGEFLIDEITSREETLYVDVKRLPPGEMLIVDSNGLKVERWWKPELSLLAYGSDEEYISEFRHLLDQAIHSRMRSNGHWGIELSGGLDSSSIAVSARAILEVEGRGDEEILTYSIASPGKEWDESEDIAAVVEKARLTATMLEPLRVGLDFFAQRAAHWQDYPGAPNGEPMSLPMTDAAKLQNVRILMSGIGGDELLDGKLAHLLDLTMKLGRRGSLRALLDRGKHDWEGYVGEGRWQVFLLKKLLVGFAPGWVRNGRRKMKLRRKGILSREFLARTHLAERVFASPKRQPWIFASRAQKAVFELLTGAHEVHVLGWNDRESAHAGVELRFPYLDRRLAEFCLRLPEEQRQDGAVWKRLLRNAMQGRLPERVREKYSKAHFGEIFDVLFSAALTQDRLTHLRMRGFTDWIDTKRLCESSATGMGLWQKWRLLATDLWFAEALNSNVALSGSTVQERRPD